MSHDPNNKDCQFSREYYNSLVCTCPPAVDEVEQIRKRNSFDSNIVYVDATPENPSWIRTVHDDRATLLRIVDQLKGRVDHNYKMALEYKAELAAAQSKLEKCDD